MLMDNNGDLLLACESGISKDSLERAGIPFTQSQLVLLETWRLLADNNDTLKTLVPILDSNSTFSLRRFTETIAARVCDSTEILVRALKKDLDHINRTSNTYSMIFSYVVDGLVWKKLEEMRFITTRTIRSENPYWAGEVWALHRPRAFSCGTNTISDQGTSICVNWSGASIPKMRPFVADFKTLGRMFDDYVAFGKVRDTSALRVFASFGLFDSEGNFTIPVVVEAQSNPLYRAAATLSDRIIRTVLASVNMSILRQKYSFRDEQQTLVIVYHEIMWDLMDAYEARGLLKKPIAFSDPSHAVPSDVSDLVFIIRPRP
jgi:hypothetical protein